MSDHLLAWIARHQRTERPHNAITDLLDGLPVAEVRADRGYPAAAMEGVRTFYDQIDRRGLRVCEGTACWSQGSAGLRERFPDAGEVRCVGHCHDAPAVRVGDEVIGGADRSLTADGDLPPEALRSGPVSRRALLPKPVVLRNLLGGPRLLPDDDYDLPDGDTILEAVDRSGLRGRGGAAFPTGRKWRAAREAPGARRYVVCNGDEGDPGSYVDRLLLEEDPHAVLAGMLACARAIRATHGIVYVRAEYPRARRVMEQAVAWAAERGLLGDFEVEVTSGGGSYVCGEETALLRSIEGLRGEPWPKPPYPAEKGLWGYPTVVQNVETLVVVPWVVRNVRLGGTKAVCLSGAIRQPGVVEIPLGMPLRRVLEEGGDGPPRGRRWRMALIGGPMGRVLDESELDVPLSYEDLPGMGHGGVVMLDETISAAQLARHLAGFAAAESCGNCTPCRVGTRQLQRVRDLPALERLLSTLSQGSLCGFGQGVPAPFRDLIRLYGDAVLA